MQRYSMYYLLLFIAHGYVDYCMLTHRIIDPRLIIHFSFLTHISFYLNFLYYTLRLLQSLNIVKNPFTSSPFRFLFQFTYVISFVVFSLFWGMLLTHPQLLSKKDVPLNPYTNVFLHGGNFILNFIENKWIHPGSILSLISKNFYFGFIIFYVSYMIIIKNITGVALYSFLEDGPVVICVVVLAGIGLLVLGDYVYRKSSGGKVKAN